MNASDSAIAHGSPLDEPLADLFAEAPRLQLRRGAMDAYQELRAQEPQLVSLVDGKPPAAAAALDAFSLSEGPRLLGAVSYLVQTNPHRQTSAQRFARIDIVVVPRPERGLGAGRLLLAAVTLHLLRSQGELLYSVSCLAAHEAVAHTLESLGFVANPREQLQYVHEELRLEDGATPALEARFAEETAAALRRVVYALRQRQSGVPR